MCSTQTIYTKTHAEYYIKYKNLKRLKRFTPRGFLLLLWYENHLNYIYELLYKGFENVCVCHWTKTVCIRKCTHKYNVFGRCICTTYNTCTCIYFISCRCPVRCKNGRPELHRRLGHRYRAGIHHLNCTYIYICASNNTTLHLCVQFFFFHYYSPFFFFILRIPLDIYLSI